MSNRIATAFNPANTRRCVNAARRLRRWPTFQQHWLNFSCSLEKNPKFWITQGWCCCCRASFRGGQEKGDQSPQIDTFRCSEWSFFWKLGLYYNMYTASLGRRDGKGSGFMWWRVLRFISSSRGTNSMHFLVRISIWNGKIKMCNEAYNRRVCEIGWSHHTSRSESQQYECEKELVVKILELLIFSKLALTTHPVSPALYPTFQLIASSRWLRHSITSCTWDGWQIGRTVSGHLLIDPQQHVWWHVCKTDPKITKHNLIY